MSGPEETFIDPDKTRDGAGRFTTAGDTLAGKWSQLFSTITTLNSAKPWGNDQPGKEFNKNYLEDGENGPAATLTLDAGKQLIDRMQMIGPDITSAVDGTVEVDDVVDKWFKGSES